MTIRLEELVGATRQAVQQRKRELPLAELEAAAGSVPEGRPFAEALSRPGTSLIAEHKRRSPSAGVIREGASVTEIVQAYERGCAAALSILTEPFHFGGSLDDLREALAATELPILRKDFIVDPYQLYESAAVGADAILLIVAALDEAGLRALLAEAAAAGLDALVEVHDAEEAALAAATGATLVGVNARNLATLEVDPGRFAEIRADLPAGAVVVAESGIRDRAGVEVVELAGADAVLVGESLVRSDDPAAAVAALRGRPAPARSGHGEAARLITAGEPRSRRWQV
jgi:indole-3-glycerol phosphate synthase